MNKLLCAVFISGLALPIVAEAGVISSVITFSLPGASTGSVGAVGVTPAPNNDNATAASPNAIPYSIFFNSPGILETQFGVTSSGGTTEYTITQAFLNNTGAPWQGFMFELGFGTGAAFTRSTSADALDFDTPTSDPQPTSSAFPTVSILDDVLTWSGATVNSIGGAAFSFAIDVPDNLQAFTLRQTPILTSTSIPEPASTLLVALGLAACCWSRRQVR